MLKESKKGLHMEGKTKISHEITVTSLPEFYEVLSLISRQEGKPGMPLWFRGASYEYYDLLPTSYRGRNFRMNSTKTYTDMSLQEELVYQSFRSQTNHLIHTNPQSGIEWNELFQHNFGQTRMLDWSESVQVALSFALEPFIHPEDKIEWREKRRSITPCIWVLNPVKLNEAVFHFFCAEENREEYVERALIEYSNLPKDFSAKVQLEMKKAQNIYFGLSADSDEKRKISINGIVSLCVLESMRNMNLPRLEQMLERYEFNPFFYLILRYYSDMLSVEATGNTRFLPPLAIVHPYHSERIRNQRGTFTVFPNYTLGSLGERQKEMNLDPRRMELQKICQECGCFYKIRILQPKTIARDMIYAGARYTQLYPDLDNYAKTLVMDSYKV